MLSCISFGKIVKVNAPVGTAQKIILMSHSHTETGKKLNKILYENAQTKAHAYSFPDNGNESFIFTGKESQEYWKSFCEAWDKMEQPRHCYRDDRNATRTSQSAWETHRKNVANIIKSYKGEILKLDAASIDSKKQINIVV